MTFSLAPVNLLPPRLSMDAYAEFVSESLRHGNPALFAWQNLIGERITKPFQIPEAQPEASPVPGSKASPIATHTPATGS